MFSFKTKSVVLGVALAALLTGCAGNSEIEALNQRMDALEDKINQALRNSASAKIDATTALKLATEFEGLNDKANEALRTAHGAKIDANTAIMMSNKK